MDILFNIGTFFTSVQVFEQIYTGLGCNYVHFKVLLYISVLNAHIEFTWNMRVLMERDFWSTEDVPLNIKKNIMIVTILMNLIVFGQVGWAIGMSCGQIILNIFPQWPFMPDKIYPYYMTAYIIFVLGEFVVIYTHSLIFMYHCYHSYCQALLLGAYIKRMAQDFSGTNVYKKAVSKKYQSAINNRMLFGIQQHITIVR